MRDVRGVEGSNRHYTVVPGIIFVGLTELEEAWVPPEVAVGREGSTRELTNFPRYHSTLPLQLRS